MDPSLVSLSNPNSFESLLSTMLLKATPSQTSSLDLGGRVKEEHQSPSSLGISGDAIPFDSPLDQSLGSPASTRDFSNSPFHDYEFDFGGVEDAIMFPDHGTQQMHNESYLSAVPLFGDYSDLKQETSFPTASQQLEAHEQLNTSSGCDFSFDAMTSASSFHATTAAKEGSQSPCPSVASQGSVGSESITQLAAVFVREYARTRDLNDIDVLLRALRVAGIDVSDEVVNDILATASFRSVSPSTSPSPSPSHGSSQSERQSTGSMSEEDNAASPSITRPAAKTRSSVQGSAKDHIVIDTRNGKRFVCTICKKHFDRAFNLRTHAMTHINPEERDKPFMCPWSECAKSFSRKYDAERHYRSVHIKKGEVASRKEVQLALSGHHNHLHVDDDEEPSNG